MKDREIVELFWKRSPQAVDALAMAYGTQLRRLAGNILSNPQDAEECVNDAYLGLWDSIPPARPQPLLPYALRVVRNLCLKRYHWNIAQKRNSQFDLAYSELESCPGGPHRTRAAAGRQGAARSPGGLSAGAFPAGQGAVFGAVLVRLHPQGAGPAPGHDGKQRGRAALPAAGEAAQVFIGKGGFGMIAKDLLTALNDIDPKLLEDVEPWGAAPKTIRRHPVWAVAAALALCLGIGTAVVLLTGQLSLVSPEGGTAVMEDSSVEQEGSTAVREDVPDIQYEEVSSEDWIMQDFETWDYPEITLHRPLTQEETALMAAQELLPEDMDFAYLGGEAGVDDQGQAYYVTFEGWREIGEQYRASGCAFRITVAPDGIPSSPAGKILHVLDGPNNEIDGVEIYAANMTLSTILRLAAKSATATQPPTIAWGSCWRATSPLASPSSPPIAMTACQGPSTQRRTPSISRPMCSSRFWKKGFPQRASAAGSRKALTILPISSTMPKICAQWRPPRRKMPPAES